MRVLGSNDEAEYARLLVQARTGETQDVIANRYPWQTTLATVELLQLAASSCESVRILAGTACEKFFDDAVTGKVRACAEAGCKVKVLVWQESLDEVAPALRRMSDEGMIELSCSGTCEHAEAIPHFCVVGQKAYRQEAPHKPVTCDTAFTRTSPEFPARICFNDSNTGLKLIGFFEALWAA